ncbi:MFSD1, partial [Symbiodinium sp. KB8]
NCGGPAASLAPIAAIRSKPACPALALFPSQMQYYFTGYLKPGASPPGPVLPVEERISYQEYQNLFSWLYSAYSWPNVILPLLGGIFSDRMGLRLGNAIFAFLVTIGQCVFALGMTLPGTHTKWAVMITGRVIFGLGGESLSVTMSGLIAKWFGGKELALALGLNLALARLGSVFNDAASPAIAEGTSLAFSLWSGALICLASFACAIAVLIIDRRASVVLKDNRRTARRTLAEGKRAADEAAATPEDDPGCASRLMLTGGDQAEAGALLGSAAPTYAATDGVNPTELAAVAAVEDDDGAGDDEQVDLRAVLRLPLSLWILTISCVTTYCAILPFNNIASDFIVTRWPTITAGTANYYMAVTYTTAGLVSPFLGAFIDCIGMRAVFCLASALVITGVHLLLGLSSITPLVGLVFMGLAYSFYAAALWPSIALVVDEEIVGTAYGLTTAAQNLGLAVVPLVISRMQVICPEDFECVSLTFAAFAGCGIVSGIVLLIVNARARLPILNLPEAMIRQLKDRVAAEDAAAAASAKDGGLLISSPSLLGTPTTPLLDGPGRVDGESVTGLSLPAAAMASRASIADASGLMVGAGTPISGDSPRLDGAAARRGHPRPRDD